MCELVEIGETILSSAVFVLASSEVYEKGLKKAKLCFVARTSMGSARVTRVVFHSSLCKNNVFSFECVSCYC